MWEKFWHEVALPLKRRFKTIFPILRLRNVEHSENNSKSLNLRVSLQRSLNSSLDNKSTDLSLLFSPFSRERSRRVTRIPHSIGIVEVRFREKFEKICAKRKVSRISLRVAEFCLRPILFSGWYSEERGYVSLERALLVLSNLRSRRKKRRDHAVCPSLGTMIYKNTHEGQLKIYKFHSYWIQ